MRRPAALFSWLPWLSWPSCALVCSTWAGCSLPSSETCQRYVACQAAIDDSVDTTAWDEGGTCWKNPQTAAACDGQCEEALDALEQVPDAPEVCLR